MFKILVQSFFPDEFDCFTTTIIEFDNRSDADIAYEKLMAPEKYQVVTNQATKLY